LNHTRRVSKESYRLDAGDFFCESDGLGDLLLPSGCPPSRALYLYGREGYGTVRAATTDEVPEAFAAWSNALPLP
jgi:hypothetical protein